MVIEVVVPAADSAFNAFHLVVRYDPAFVVFVPTAPVSAQVGPVVSDACSNLFHQFNAYGDSNLDSTVTDLSLLCSQTFVTGPGVIYRLKFQAGSVPGAVVCGRELVISCLLFVFKLPVSALFGLCGIHFTLSPLDPLLPKVVKLCG